MVHTKIITLKLMVKPNWFIYIHFQGFLFEYKLTSFSTLGDVLNKDRPTQTFSRTIKRSLKKFICISCLLNYYNWKVWLCKPGFDVFAW